MAQPDQNLTEEVFRIATEMATAVGIKPPERADFADVEISQTVPARLPTAAPVSPEVAAAEQQAVQDALRGMRVAAGLPPLPPGAAL